MRRALPRLSYYVKSSEYYLPVLFPECSDYLDRWVRHVLCDHAFVQCSSLDTEDLDHVCVKGEFER